MKVNITNFGTLSDGRDAACFHLLNNNGTSVKVSNYGATIISIKTADHLGEFGDVVLGFDDVSAYEEDRLFFGALIGRYANRISEGKCSIDGLNYQLSKNEDDHHLHGGPDGFHKKIWSVDDYRSENSKDPLIMRYKSMDGEEGYPGTLICEIHFFLNEANGLEIIYLCKSDKTTIVSLVHHPYFNLNDGGLTRIDDHELMIKADYYTPFQSDHLPTGEILPVDKTYFDFRQYTSLKSKLSHKPPQYDRGYNVNYVLNAQRGFDQPAASLYAPDSGRLLEIFTSYPALQFYSGGYLSADKKQAPDNNYHDEHGLCLEPQFFPDAINQPNFPSPILKSGELYHHKTLYKISVIPSQILQGTRL